MWIAIGILAVLGVILFGGGAPLIRGLSKVFVKNLAETSEGAEAIYTEKISETQNEYNQANDTMTRIAGQLDSAERSVVDSKKALKDCEDKCERFAKSGEFEKVQLFSAEREELLIDIEGLNVLVKDLVPALTEAREINTILETRLVNLKKEKKKVLQDFKTNKQLKEVFDSMDELKKTTKTDKLLDDVKNKVKETREQAVGARIVHENKMSTKINKANAADKVNQTNDYVEQLRKKYQTTETKK